MVKKTKAPAPRISALIGKKYKAYGRGPEYYDCWGLAIEAVKILTGVEIPDYKLDPEDQESNNAFLLKIATIDGTWQEVKTKDIKPGLLVALELYRPGALTHAGVTTGNGLFIHCIEKKGVTIEPLKKYQKLIGGYYEFKG